MLNQSKIVKVGTDTSDRPIFMTRYMQRWWKRVIKDCGFTPTIIQGAYMVMAGGGAPDSEGYHDGGGCLDLRTWDRTPAELVTMNRVIRNRGAGGWIRDERHGMDPHYHLVLGSDFGLSAGAKQQWNQYIGGGNGLSNRLRDYMWRPNPLVLKPVYVNKAPLMGALANAIDKARAVGYDGAVTRLKAVRKSVKDK